MTKNGRHAGEFVPLPTGERVAAQRPGEGAYAPKPARCTKPFARAMRKNPTDAEYLLWFELRSRNLNGYRFSRQVRIGPYIADFCCRAEKLIVELDGAQHSGSPSDERRTAWLIGQDYSVLRFWNDEVVFERGAVLDTILAALERRLLPPHPTAASAQLRFTVPSYPSPRGERTEPVDTE